MRRSALGHDEASGAPDEDRFRSPEFSGPVLAPVPELRRRGARGRGPRDGQAMRDPGREVLSPTMPSPVRRTRPIQNRYSPVIPRLRRAYGVAHRAKELAKQGFEPDVVVVNTGWGENLFLKDIWPKARHVAYFEYYYHAKGQDLDFDPEFPVTNEEVIWRLRLKNSMQLGALDAADLAVAPDPLPARHVPDLSARPARHHPRRHRHKEAPARSRGVGSSSARTGPMLTRDTPVVTYVTRNIEPMRGAHIVFKSLPYLLDIDPELQVVIIGGQRHQLFRLGAGGEDLVRRLQVEDRAAGRLVAGAFRRKPALRPVREGAAGLLGPCLHDLSLRAVLVAPSSPWRWNAGSWPRTRSRCARSSRTG